MSSQTFPLGIIGAGKMAEALIKGGLQTKCLAPDSVIIHEINPERVTYIYNTYQIKSVSLEQLSTKTSLILLAIKPQQCNELLAKLNPYLENHHCLISILAGKTLSSFQQILSATHQIVRVMPNTPALVLAGMSAISFNPYITDINRHYILRLFSAVGQVLEMNEDLMNAVTALSGSGPAFVYHFANEMIMAAVTKGLSQTQAHQLCAQTLIGAGKMLIETNKTAEQLIADVSSPAGTTLAGLAKLQTHQFHEIIAQTIEAAYNRSIELGDFK